MQRSITEILHVNYSAGPAWQYPILNRLNATTSEALRERYRSWPEALSEKSLALATKLRLLPIVSDTVERQWQSLIAELAKIPADDIAKCIAQGRVPVLEDDLAAFRLILAIDSFVFEVRSAYEIFGKFVRKFFSVLFQKRIDEKAIRQMLISRSCDLTWTDLLHDDRIEFFHNTAPWLALEVIGRNPFKFDLVILRRNTIDLANPQDYELFDAYRGIWRGLASALRVMQEIIIHEITEFETTN